MWDSEPGAPEEGGASEKYYGKYPGLVLSNAKPDDGDHRGELLVEVAGILEEKPNSDEQRPLQVVAAPCFLPGFFFIPEVNDPVWVEFVAGDINQPVWTGVWYPKDRVPKTAADAAPTELQNIIRTASGHVIQIDDTGDEEKIIIKHTGGATLQIDENGSVLIASETGSFAYLNADDGELTLGEEHGNLLTMTEDGVLVANIDSKVTLELKDGKLTIMAKGGVDVMAPKVALHSSTISLGGQAAIEPAVLGQTFMALYNAHVHATAVGPSGPPVPPLTPLVLSQAVKVRP